MRGASELVQKLRAYSNAGLYARGMGYVERK